MQRNILMICYYFPPLLDVGCKRSVAFAKYFKKHGWNPSVLSVKNPDPNYCSIGNDSVPDGVYTKYSYSLINFYRTLGRINGLFTHVASLFRINIKRNYLYDIVCIPDPFWGWLPLAVIKGYHLVKTRKIDTIYVSCSPFSSALIGVVLKKLLNKPLIVDFRDPFALDIVNSQIGLPKWRRSINKFIEKYIFNNSDVLIVNNIATRTAYLEQYPEFLKKIFAVHNGFEEGQAVLSKSEKFNKFTIAYAGQFYWYANRSLAFFKALALLKSNGKINNESFQFLFYGEGEDKINDLAKEYSVEDLVIARSRIPYQKVMAVLSQAHLQLLKIVAPMLSTKLFEGIPLNVPFLAPISSFEAEQIIKQYSPSSYVVPENSAVKISEAIQDAMMRYKDGKVVQNRINEFLSDFSRENLTIKTMSIIDKLLSA